uniref:Adhesion G-protein coupled receptor D2-like n=2 Tax=Astyanax mexicanus TaxID=7994 RepID=W5LE35_ASTMX
MSLNTVYLFFFCRMQFLGIICSNMIILIHHWMGKAHSIAPESRTPSTNEEIDVVKLCRQQLGIVAVVPSTEENHNQTIFLLSGNISLPQWIIGRDTTEISGTASDTLEFLCQNEHGSARLQHTFSNMSAVSVCSRVRFDPNHYGDFIVFSYSTTLFTNEFQLRAKVSPKEIKVALCVHGNQSSYHTAFANNASFHSLCVIWAGNSGNWSFSVDGQAFDGGNLQHPSKHIRGDGFFTVGQEQDMLNGSLNSEKTFCGSITQLYIWNRMLGANEIQTMEKECKPVISGLIFKWNTSGLIIKNNFIQMHRESFHCRVISQMPNKDTCVTYDPDSGKCYMDLCETQNGNDNQFQKDNTENFPNTPFFTEVIKYLQASPDLEDFNSTSPTDSELLRLSLIAQSVVKVINNSPGIITPSDLLYLTQTIEMAAAAQANKTSVSSAIVMSMTTNYLNLASGLIDPAMEKQWEDLKPLGIQHRPWMVVENIDKLLWALADTIYAEKTSFKVSSKNLDVYMEPKRLSQMSCSCVYKPSTQAVQSGSQDEILIPDTEVQRVYSLGHKDVMFIHSYYSSLSDILFQSEIKAPVLQKTDSARSSVRRLATAIISATVRDVSMGKNVPVSVQYSLSTVKKVEYSKPVTPACMFWNVSMMGTYASDWSDKGCVVLHSGSDTTSCFCNHTTNFAVLMNYMEIRWSAEEESILTKLTFIGSGASLCALVVTLMLFTVLDIPKSDRISIHKNLFISLTLAQIVLLCSGSAIHNKVACTMVAALLHLFFMAAFSWMLVEGLLLWSKVVTVNLSEDRHMKYYYLIGWGLPVLIVTITLASASGNYSADGHCWLSVQNGVIWGFAGPVIFIIMVNIMVLTRVVVITISTAKRRSLMLAANTSPVEQVSEQIRAAIKAVLVLLPILGLTWLCGVLVPFSIIMAYIFILLNSLQGLFIFLIYGVYNTEIRNTVRRFKERRKAQNFSNCGSSRPSSSVHSSRPGSSPVPGSLGGLGVDANHPGSFSTASDSTSLSYSHERHLSLPCVNGNLDEDPNCHPVGIYMTGEEHVEPLDCVADSCSLHVPMDEELSSCRALGSCPQHHNSADPF